MLEQKPPLPGNMTTSTNRIGGDGANVLFVAEVLNPLLRLEHSLRSGGTPRITDKAEPGECKVPGLPNKISSRPITATSHTGVHAG